MSRVGAGGHSSEDQPACFPHSAVRRPCRFKTAVDRYSALCAAALDGSKKAIAERHQQQQRYQDVEAAWTLRRSNV